MSTPQTKANLKYRDKTYSRIELLVPKEEKEMIDNYAKSIGCSTAKFCKDSIRRRMNRTTNP
jgi:hypothetical protein